MKIYAIHKSGKRLYYPTEDALRCTSVPRSEIAAITNQRGVTYPEGTFYLLGPDGNPKDGWHRVDDPTENAENGHNLMGCRHGNATGAIETAGVGGMGHAG